MGRVGSSRPWSIHDCILSKFIGDISAEKLHPVSRYSLAKWQPSMRWYRAHTGSRILSLRAQCAAASDHLGTVLELSHAASDLCVHVQTSFPFLMTDLVRDECACCRPQACQRA